MLLAALVDAGAPLATIEAAVAALGLASEVELSVHEVERAGLRAIRIPIRIASDAPRRRVPEMVDTIERSGLAPDVVARSVAALRRLASVEASLHGVDQDELHLHELSGSDTLVDIVGFYAALDALAVGDVTVSPINVGSGTVRLTHGSVGVPAPATAELLKGWPIHGSAEAGEATTPTAAALLADPRHRSGVLPRMSVTAVGYGAGSRDTPHPNVVRCFLGEVAAPRAGWMTETIVVLESNIDDMDPRHFEHASAALFAAGALDVHLVPMIGKRARPGVIVGVIARPEDADALTAVLFGETSTLGVRRRITERAALARRMEERSTTLGPVRVKVATLPGGGERASPEHADLVRIARERGIPLIEVARRVERELGP